MCTYCKRPPAQPLSPAEVEEFKSEGWQELLIDIDGKTYNREDCYSCDGCELVTPDAHDLEEGFCEDCTREGEEEREHQRQLRSDYYASVL